MVPISANNKVSTLCYWLIFHAMVMTLAVASIDDNMKRLRKEQAKNYVHRLCKRNTWWSKKSQISPTNEDEYGNDDGDVNDAQCTNMKQAVDCYIKKCVPELGLCAHMASTFGRLMQCRNGHKECANGCFNDSKVLSTLVTNLK
ncbi:Uncharacterised protein g2609 [Pycnogonum litorale]